MVLTENSGKTLFLYKCCDVIAKDTHWNILIYEQKKN